MGTLTLNPTNPMKRLLSLLAVLAAVVGVRAADAPGLVNGNPPDMRTLKSGDAAPDFALPGIDGRVWRLADFGATDVLMVLFTSNHWASSLPTRKAHVSMSVDCLSGSCARS